MAATVPVARSAAMWSARPVAEVSADLGYEPIADLAVAAINEQSLCALARLLGDVDRRQVSRAVTPACFIRYAAAATWPPGSIVASAGRMTSAAVAGARGGRCRDSLWVKVSVVIRSVSGEPRQDPVD